MSIATQAPPFHLAFPVTNIEATREFYTKLLGCRVGRESVRWIDFDFFGHQITAHCVDHMPSVPTNPVDGHEVPSSHFGVVMEWDAWHELAERLKKSGINFLLEPYIRFRGEVGEQATLFIRDPSGNGLEFKSFKNPANLFAT